MKQNAAVKQPKRKGLLEQYRKNYDIVLMIVPGLLALFFFCYLPMSGIALAFKDFKVLKGIWGSPWCGLDNFEKLFSTNDFWVVTKNTVVISLLKLVFGFPAPVILAILLNEIRNSTYKKTIQTLSYLPHFFSWVVLSGIIKMIFSTQGPINMFYREISNMSGNAKFYLDFFGDTKLFLGLVIGTAVWQGLGWGAIIYIAALSGVDESLYEAAYIDGAGRFKQALYISIPCLIPTIITVLILNLGSILNAGFDQIYNLQNETVKSVSNIMDIYVMDTIGTPSKYGVGTAMGLFKSVVGMIFVIGTNKLSSKISDGELGIM